MASPDVIVIGAGVVGLSAAIAAQGRGLSIVVLDKTGPAAGASAGNAGAFAFTDILPLASPGILRKAPKWLLDPLGPLSVPPAYALRIAPWMFRFWRACSPARVAHSTAAQTADLSKAELEPSCRRPAPSECCARTAISRSMKVSRAGGLTARLAGPRTASPSTISTPPAWPRSSPASRRASPMAPSRPAGIRSQTPGLYARAGRAFPRPRRHIERLEVESLAPSDGGVTIQARGGQTRQASRSCSRPAPSPIASPASASASARNRARLQHHPAAGAFDLRTQVTFGGHGFVVSRLSTGIRVGGAVELGGLDLPPNFRRSEAMLAKARAFLPGLKPDDGVQWMGFRPSLPDSLPAIGRARATPRVVYAFGTAISA
jgi:D-amino-acid dehydrogenase